MWAERVRVHLDRRSRTADNAGMLGASHEDSAPMLYEGVGMFVRGDLVIVQHRASASLDRSRWLFKTFEELPGPSYVILLLVGEDARPPDQAVRDHDNAAYTRISGKVRRLIVVAEGDGFSTSLVRLVINAYARFTGKGHMFAFARDLPQAVEWIEEQKSPDTPGPEQLAADLSSLRLALEREPRRSRAPG